MTKMPPNNQSEGEKCEHEFANLNITGILVCKKCGWHDLEPSPSSTETAEGWEERFRDEFLYTVVLGSTLNDGNALRFKRVNQDGQDVLDFIRTEIEKAEKRGYSSQWKENYTKAFGEEIRHTAIDECIAALPEEKETYKTNKDFIYDQEEVGFNKALEKVNEALLALKK